MRTRWQLLGAAVLVAATAIASTTASVRHADATDARLRAAALAKVHLSLVTPSDGSIPPDATAGGYGVMLHNDGTVGVVVRRATWSGGPPVDLRTALPVQGDGELVLPEPSPCPAHQVTEGLDHVDVQVEVAGGRRTLRLELPDPTQPRDAVNSRCGLGPAAQSVLTAISFRKAGPGHVELDLSAFSTGSQATELVAVRAAAGVDAQVVEALPRTLVPAPPGTGGALLPHLLTVRLTLRDCSVVRQSRRLVLDGVEVLPVNKVPAPEYFELQLDLRHPGEPLEQLDLGYPVDAANAFAAPCHVPRLQTGNAG